MNLLTDELLQRRLAERGLGDGIAMGPLARSVAAHPQPRPIRFAPLAGLGLAAAAVVAIALALAPIASSPRLGASASSPSGRIAPMGSAPTVPNPARWTGLTWTAGSSDPFASADTQVNDVLAVDEGFLAVGTTTTGGRLVGTMWRSPDGIGWGRVDDPGIASIVPRRVLPFGNGLAVIGAIRTADGDAEPAQLWTSPDGTGWKRGPDLPAGANGDRAASGPSGLLTVGAGPDRQGRVSFLPVGGSAWTATSGWAPDTQLGWPAWFGGRWLLPGTTGTDVNGAPSQAAVWTSADATSWTAAAVDDPKGGMFEILPAAGGVIAIGTDQSICGQCFGPIVLRNTFWTSSDGQTWHRLASDPGLRPWTGTQIASDGRRIVALVPRAPDSDEAAGQVLQSTDGSTWQGVPSTGDVPDPLESAGRVGVGPSGIVVLPAGGSSSHRVWWATATATGGTPLPSVSPSATPLGRAIRGCEARHFSVIRCSALVNRAIQQSGGGDPVAVEVGPPKDSGISLGSPSLAVVTLHYADGSTRDADIRCFGVMVGGSSSDRVCSDDPQIVLATGVSHDIPCGPEPGDESHPCVPPPTPGPASIAASQPLVVRTVDVPIDHVGHYEIAAGAASLPDGAISQRDGTIGDPRPTGFWIDGAIEIQVRSDIPGRPIADSYNRDRYDGPEPVHVFLVFDVTELTGGGTLEIRNLVVR